MGVGVRSSPVHERGLLQSILRRKLASRSRVLTYTVIKWLWGDTNQEGKAKKGNPRIQINLNPKAQVGNDLSLEVLLGSGVDGQTAY